MRKAEFYPALQAVLAAALFGISTPLAKVLLGNFQPVTLAAFLYLGSRIGLSFFLVVTHVTKKQTEKEASLPKKDLLWLDGAIVFGGILTPIISMLSLESLSLA